MDLGLEGKIAWVLGASSGLGRATAEALAREGAAVAVSARRADELHKLVESITSAGGRALDVAVDVTDPESIASGAARISRGLGPIDVLISNGGGPPPGPFAAFGDDTLYDAFTLVTASAWRLAKAVVPSMQERGSGCLVFVTSSSTKEVIEGLLLSNMMRAAVVGMAKTLSKELGPAGIRVLCVAPGRIDTARVRSLDATVATGSGQTSDEVRSASETSIPLRRYGEPREFGDVVAFLCSERASYVSGTTIVVDGGKLQGVSS
jgi:3-oxoacyl-[acyl-carrier protein] reductase